MHFIVLESYWCQQHRSSYPDSVTSSGHRICVHCLFEIPVVLGEPSLVRTNEKQRGLSQGCKRGRALSSSTMIFFDGFPGKFFRTVWCVSVKQVNVTLCTNCYTMWKKMSVNRSFWIQNTLPMILPANSWVLAFRELNAPILDTCISQEHFPVYCFTRADFLLVSPHSLQFW
jgi:hypothetical protein